MSDRTAEPIARPVLPNPPADNSYAYQVGVTITPAYAMKLIEANAANQRNKKPARIAAYKADMRADRWRPRTGETIKVSDTGFLIDGQNRMFAVVDADVPAVFDIAWNVPERNIEVVDGNAPRNMGDRFRIHGAPEAHAVAPALRWIIAIENENTNPMLSGYGYQPTHTEMQERYQADAPRIDAAVARGLDLKRAIRGANAGAAGVAYYLFHKLDPVTADLFWTKLVTGANIAPGNPIFAMRERFVGPTGRFLNRKEQLALIIRTFNGWTASENLASIQLPRNGLNNITFPLPKLGGFPDGKPEEE